MHVARRKKALMLISPNLMNRIRGYWFGKRIWVRKRSLPTEDFYSYGIHGDTPGQQDQQLGSHVPEMRSFKRYFPHGVVQCRQRQDIDKPLYALRHQALGKKSTGQEILGEHEKIGIDRDHVLVLRNAADDKSETHKDQQTHQAQGH